MTVVSVVVICFNSRDYIVDCLESIRRQTHQHLELVITDDASTDDAVKIAEKWLAENRLRFTHRSAVITNDKNRGITVNANRGAMFASGDYLKFIAADDTLSDHSISTLLDTAIRTNSEIVFSNVAPMRAQTPENQIADYYRVNDYERFFRYTHRKQHEDLLRNTAPHTLIVGSLFKSKRLMSLGYFDEKYPMMEDYPLLLKIFRLNLPIEFTRQICAYYRTKPADYRLKNKNSPRFKTHALDLSKFRRDVVLPELFRQRMICSYLFVGGADLVTALELKTSNRIIFMLIDFLRKARHATRPLRYF